jgi:hypothetical protein
MNDTHAAATKAEFKMQTNTSTTNVPASLYYLCGMYGVPGIMKFLELGVPAREIVYRAVPQCDDAVDLTAALKACRAPKFDLFLDLHYPMPPRELFALFNKRDGHFIVSSCGCFTTASPERKASALANKPGNWTYEYTEARDDDVCDVDASSDEDTFQVGSTAPVTGGKGSAPVASKLRGKAKEAADALLMNEVLQFNRHHRFTAGLVAACFKITTKEANRVLYKLQKTGKTRIVAGRGFKDEKGKPSWVSV